MSEDKTPVVIVPYETTRTEYVTKDVHIPRRFNLLDQPFELGARRVRSAQLSKYSNSLTPGTTWQ